MKRLLPLAGLFVAAATCSAIPAQPDPGNGDIILPEGFGAVVVADNLGPLRFIAVTPAGDVFVKSERKGIFALRDTDGDGHADVKREFGSGGGTGIVWRDGWLYHSTDDDIIRYPLPSGSLEPTGDAEVIVKGLPNERMHAAKSFAFDGSGRLYTDVGAPTNAAGHPDRAKGAKGERPATVLERHGGIWRFDANKQNQDQVRDGYRFSTGSRHILAIRWNPVSSAMFVVMMGRDQLNTVAPEYYDVKANAELPAEEMHRLDEGVNLGWPYTYWDPIKKGRYLAPEYGGDGNKQPEEKYDPPLIAFPAHWAPLQMSFNPGGNFPDRYKGGAFISFHGSWNRAPEPQKGYCVVFVPFGSDGMPTGAYEKFADGFAGATELMSPGNARFRPTGCAFGPDGSLYVSDSQKGRVWRIFYMGEKTASAAGASDTSVAAAAVVDGARVSAGAKVYADNCAVCHMEDGGGVPTMQPSLVKSAVVAGDPSTVIQVVLRGPDEVLPADRPPYNNAMPDFAELDDASIAAVLNYVRHNLAGHESAITAEMVAAGRKAVH